MRVTRAESRPVSLSVSGGVGAGVLSTACVVVPTPAIGRSPQYSCRTLHRKTDLHIVAAARPTFHFTSNSLRYQLRTRPHPHRPDSHSDCNLYTPHELRIRPDAYTERRGDQFYRTLLEKDGTAMSTTTAGYECFPPEYRWEPIDTMYFAPGLCPSRYYVASSTSKPSSVLGVVPRKLLF